MLMDIQLSVFDVILVVCKLGILVQNFVMGDICGNIVWMLGGVVLGCQEFKDIVVFELQVVGGWDIDEMDLLVVMNFDIK